MGCKNTKSVFIDEKYVSVFAQKFQEKEELIFFSMRKKQNN